MRRLMPSEDVYETDKAVMVIVSIWNSMPVSFSLALIASSVGQVVCERLCEAAAIMIGRKRAAQSLAPCLEMGGRHCP